MIRVSLCYCYFLIPLWSFLFVSMYHGFHGKWTNRNHVKGLKKEFFINIQMAFFSSGKVYKVTMMEVWGDLLAVIAASMLLKIWNPRTAGVPFVLSLTELLIVKKSQWFFPLVFVPGCALERTLAAWCGGDILDRSCVCVDNVALSCWPGLERERKEETL